METLGVAGILWTEEEPDVLDTILIPIFNGLKAFYGRAARAGQYVLEFMGEMPTHHKLPPSELSIPHRYFDVRGLAVLLRISSISRIIFRPAFVPPFVLSGSDSNSARIWSDMALSVA